MPTRRCMPYPRCLHSKQVIVYKNILVKVLNPYWIVGFVDGEGSFMLSIYKREDVKSGFHLTATFAITLHEKDTVLLYSIKSYFGVGEVRTFAKNGTVTYSVSVLKDLANVIIPFFLKYPLLTQKGADFLLFKSIVELMSNKEHLNPEGLRKILSFKAALNRGFTGTLSKYFPDITPVAKPSIETTEIPDNNWLAGFTDAEGSFGVTVYKSKTNIGFAVGLRFRLTQDGRDLKLLQIISNHLSCGRLCTEPTNSAIRLDVAGLSDLINIIIPLFKKYPLLGSKRLDFDSFTIVAGIKEIKGHLTSEGLDKIRLIKAGMNTGRDYTQ